MKKLLHYLLAKFRIFDILANQERIRQQNYRQGQEIIKAFVFNNTITDSEWLKYKSFSPGVWAADYGLLYTLYRVLNGVKPSCLLEFGLGQSSKMIHQYASFYNKEAITCEHDENWVKFFREGNDGKYAVNIQKMELEKVLYKNVETLSYKNTQEIFREKRFDFILVDGPFGSKHYSRSQIISLAEHNLMKSFCIIIDDCEREGEKETIYEILSVLKSQGIEYACRTYSSEKDHFLICSKELSFLTTL